ncbi:MAG: phosphoserine phosphatase SerB, partial [Hyphomicrobiales bacterium]|nr:phosphoserine phosphatase SerB [Hyphomicrobiales bacterium]
MKFVLSLIASPAAPVLDDAVVAGVCRHLGLDPVESNWLARGVACDIPIDNAGEVQRQARQFVAGRPIDANVIAQDNRRKQLLIADMDSTIIEQECIDELGIVAGAGEEIKEVTRRAMRGELDFVESLRGRVALMRGLAASAITDVIENRITFVGGGRTLVQTMKANGAYCALISGGFSHFTSHVAGVCGFDTHQANELIIEDGVLTGKVAKPELGGAAKVTALNKLADEHRITVADAVAVGDGANDLGTLGLAGMGVAMHAKPAVREAANTVIDHSDLTALLYLQGYAKAEFA